MTEVRSSFILISLKLSIAYLAEEVGHKENTFSGWRIWVANRRETFLDLKKKKKSPYKRPVLENWWGSKRVGQGSDLLRQKMLPTVLISIEMSQ